MATQKGYNLVGGKLVLVDQNPFNWGGGSTAQMYMTDAERDSRDWSGAITPTPGASAPAPAPAPSPAPAPATFESAYNAINPPRSDPFGLNSGKLAQTQRDLNPTAAPDGAYYSQANKRIAPGQFTKTTEISMADYMSGKYGQDVTLNALSGKAYRHEIVSPDAVMSAYNPSTPSAPAAAPAPAPAPAPTIVDTPAPSPNVAQATTPVKTNAEVQAAGTQEKKIIQDTFDRVDTIISAPQDLYGSATGGEENTYRVRAGYRRKSRLGA